ncbi:MAG TPA: GDP-mannose 4,6-dehydratase [Gemmatimonadales bacterium]
MRVLVTGANGFTGGWLIRSLLQGGHEVIGAAGPIAGQRLLTPAERDQVTWVVLDVDDPGSVRACAAVAVDAVVHLAAVSSVAHSLAEPVATWRVNTVGTMSLLETLAVQRRNGISDPLVLVVSTGEVYGPGSSEPRRETEPVRPVSPYAASKAAAELGGLEIWHRTGLRVVVARPFPHTGPGQTARFVVPAFLERIRIARRAGAPVVKTGNLEPVRDLLDVRDVTAGYLALLERGAPGEIYNVATGRGLSLEEVFFRVAERVGHHAIPELDPALARAVDIPHLVGDPEKLHAATGWSPHYTLDQTLQLMLDAEAY